MSWGQGIEPFDWKLTVRVLAVYFILVAAFLLFAGCTTGDRKRCYEGNMACMSAQEIKDRLNE